METLIVTIDKTGRIVVPKALRDQLRLRPGAELQLIDAGDHLELRPVEPAPALVREGGWWVYTGAAEPGVVEDAVHRHREDRIDDLAR
jgi:AbrB family looped-hinge helix DNA binding protein